MIEIADRGSSEPATIPAPKRAGMGFVVGDCREDSPQESGETAV
jgi:hypothetical protein